jgi:hypothetical protein
MSTLNPSAIRVQAEPRVLSARAFEPEFYNISLMPGQTLTDTGEVSSGENCQRLNVGKLGVRSFNEVPLLAALTT